MSATWGQPGSDKMPSDDKRARGRVIRKALRLAGRNGLNLNIAGRGWYQPDDWWNEGERIRRRKSGEIIWCGGWQPAKMPKKYLR
jgi:hypothetical protein